MARILVVEDNPDVREMVARMLELDGHVCVEAEDGLAGLDEALRSTAPFDLIVGDVDMPHLNGVDLLAAIRRTPRGRLRFIFISGAWSPDEVDTRPEHPEEFLAFLPKPFGRKTLCDLVDRALAA